jgi:hypothetical protein
LRLLLPVKQWESWDLLTQRHQFPWHLRIKASGRVLGGVWHSDLLCVSGSGTFCCIMEPGATQ